MQAMEHDGFSSCQPLRQQGVNAVLRGHAGVDRGGMSMSSANVQEKLKTTEGFDLALIDAMTPHHPTADRMASDMHAEPRNRGGKALAAAIVTTWEREIAQMRGWRRLWYGR